VEIIGRVSPDAHGVSTRTPVTAHRPGHPRAADERDLAGDQVGRGVEQPGRHAQLLARGVDGQRVQRAAQQPAQDFGRPLGRERLRRPRHVVEDLRHRTGARQHRVHHPLEVLRRVAHAPKRARRGEVRPLAQLSVGASRIPDAGPIPAGCGRP
jgi:hypothetical protein